MERLSTKTPALFSFIFALAACATNSVAQPVVLKVTSPMPASSTGQVGVIEPWCAAIEKDSGGRLKCQIYPSMTLGGTPAQIFDQVKNGIADVGTTSPAYTTGRFPRSEAMELPFMLPAGSLPATRAMWEYVQKHAVDEYKDFKVLAVWSSSNAVLNTASKPVVTLEDLKGLKIRSPSRFGAMFLSAMGVVPVNLPLAQVTEAVSKGIVDGAMAPWEALGPTKIDEVTTYHMEGASGEPGFAQTPLMMLMNKARYDSLEPEVKAAIDKHSGLVLSERSGKLWDDQNRKARQALSAGNHKILTFKEVDYAVMKKTGVSVEANWIKEANARGLDGAALVAEIRALGKKHMSE